MYGIIRRYQIEPANREEIVRRAREGFLPLIGAAPGLVSYALVDAGARSFTVGIFETEEQAAASTRLAAGWVREHLAALMPTPPTVLAGPIRLRAVGAAELAATVLRVYRVDPASVDEVVRRAEAGFVPLISAAPGFARYAILDAGGGTLVSLSAFATAQQIDQSTSLAADWVREHLAPLLPSPPEVVAGTVRAFQAGTPAVGSRG